MKRKLSLVSLNFTNLNHPENHLDLLPKRDLLPEEKLQENHPENHPEENHPENHLENYLEENHQENHHVNLLEEDKVN